MAHVLEPAAAPDTASAPPPRAVTEVLRASPRLRRFSADDLPWEVPFSELGFDAQEVLGLLLELESALSVSFDNADLRRDSLATPGALAHLAALKLAAAEPTAAGRRTRLGRFVHLTPRFLPHIFGTVLNIAELCRQLGEWLDFEVYSYDLDGGLPRRELRQGIPVRRFHTPRFVEILHLGRRRDAVAAAGLDAERLCNYQLDSTELFHTLQASGADGIVSWFYSTILGQDIVDFFPSKRWLLIPSLFEPPGQPGRRAANPSYWDPRRVDRVLFFQQREYRMALEHGVPEAKLTWVPWPVDTDRFRPLGLERRRDTLLYVGRLTRNKGIAAFLETFRWMVEKKPSLRLRLVADLDPPTPVERQGVAEVRAAVERLGLADRVELPGRKDGEEVVRELSSHQIHILPSIADFYSTVTTEALACGMTCVNLERPCYEWQRRRDGGEPLVHLCPSLPEMGATILRLLEAAELPDHREYMVEHLSWKAHRDAYRDFFLP
jgi:glycosyltransferase involved in cell wall biosynthesis